MARTLPAGLAGHPALWRGKQRRHEHAVLATGHTRLDQALPALAQVTAAGRWALLVNPPWTPYPPALCGHGVNLARLLLVQAPRAEDALWACEQALRGMHGGMVLAWAPPTARFAQLRRLQLAARSGGKVAILFRAAGAAASATPAPLRLHLQAGGDELQLRVLKCRGARPGGLIRLRQAHRGLQAAAQAEPGEAAAALCRPPGEARCRPLPEARQ